MPPRYNNAQQENSLSYQKRNFCAYAQSFYFEIVLSITFGVLPEGAVALAPKVHGAGGYALLTFGVQ